MIKNIFSDKIEALEKEAAELIIGKDTYRTMLAKNGGLNREAFFAEGLDPEHFKNNGKVIGKPLFPKSGGMTPDGVAELLNQELPATKYTADTALEFVHSILTNDVYLDADVTLQLKHIHYEIALLSTDWDC